MILSLKLYLSNLNYLVLHCVWVCVCVVVVVCLDLTMHVTSIKQLAGYQWYESSFIVLRCCCFLLMLLSGSLLSSGRVILSLGGGLSLMLMFCIYFIDRR